MEYQVGLQLLNQAVSAIKSGDTLNWGNWERRRPRREGFAYISGTGIYYSHPFTLVFRESSADKVRGQLRSPKLTRYDIQVKLEVGNGWPTPNEVLKHATAIGESEKSHAKMDKTRRDIEAWAYKTFGIENIRFG